MRLVIGIFISVFSLNASAQTSKRTDLAPISNASAFKKSKVDQVVEFEAQKEIKLRKRLLETISKGTESSGGGSSNRKIFYEPLGKALRALTRTPYYSFGSQTISTEMLVIALRAVTLEPVNSQLYDRQGYLVDFYNDPDLLVLKYNVDAWQKLSELEKFQFGIHELLGVLQMPDPYFKNSIVLSQTAQAILKEEKQERRLYYVADFAPGFTAKDLLQFLDYDRQLGFSSSITNRCEHYIHDFRGSCYVRLTTKDGLAFEEVSPLPSFEK